MATVTPIAIVVPGRAMQLPVQISPTDFVFDVENAGDAPSPTAFLTSPIPDDAAIVFTLTLPPSHDPHGTARFVGYLDNKQPSCTLRTAAFTHTAANVASNSTASSAKVFSSFTVKIVASARPLTEGDELVAGEELGRLSGGEGAALATRLARGVGRDLYAFLASFDGVAEALPPGALEAWAGKFGDKVARRGVDWLVKDVE